MFVGEMRVEDEIQLLAVVINPAAQSFGEVAVVSGPMGGEDGVRLDRSRRWRPRKKIPA